MTEQAGIATARDDQTPMRVAVIEDEASVRGLLEEFLRHRGYDVRGFSNGEEGVIGLETEPADIVLTDINMPGMSGMEVLRRVRQTWPASEVVVITGFATVQVAVEALRAGAYDFLLKPAHLPQIEAVFRRCSERIRYARENRELRQVVDQLQELSRRRETFIALANHELRTPTAVASGVVSLLRDQKEKMPEELARLVTRAYDAMERLRVVVNDLGEMAQARTSESWLKLLPCRVGDMVGEIERLCRMYAGLRDAEVGVQSDASPEREVLVDRVRVVRAVGALVQNGVKFTPDGGSVRVKVSAQGEQLRFDVLDTGVGVPPEQEERIFDPFYKVGDPINHHSSGHEFGGGGLGVGLSLARDVAEAHGGKLTYAPNEGGGSIFSLTIQTEAPVSA